MRKNIHQLVQTNMTRKEFLATLGVGAITLLGFANIVKFFGHSTEAPHQASGYGTSPYGK